MSPLGGEQVATQSEAQRLGFNENQMAIFMRSFFVSTWMTLYQIITFLGGSYMLAATLQDGYVSTGLPNNQWQLELDHYFGVAMHTIQLWSQQYISGPTRQQNDKYIKLATGHFARKMCHNQIARRADYRSFNVLGLAIVLTFGLTVIILNMSIRNIVQCIQGHTVKGRFRNAEWQANDFLQLQRMAYQHNDMGTWTGQHDQVPRTRPGELFTLPDSADWRHDGVVQPTKREKHRMSRSWSRGWSYRGKEAKSAVEEAPSPSLSANEKPAVANEIREKTAAATGVERSK
jgi:hypothetical protein